MGRVVLLNPPGDKLYLRDQHCSSVSKANYYWPPVDLIMLSGLLSTDHEVVVIDAIIENISEEECIKKISLVKPDYIFFITGIASWINDFKFIEKLKTNTEAKIIASGGLLRSDYMNVMHKYKFLDAIIMDYTSKSVLDYMNGLEESIFDMCIRRGEDVILMPSSNLKEFSLPIPLHELFPLEKYRLPHNRYMPFTSILTSFGCPYQCSFCVASRIDFKYRPVSNVIEELEKLQTLGIREVFFKDFTFGVPRERSIQLCEEITKKIPNLSWVCSSRVNVIDEKLLKAMKAAGCHTIHFGVESAAQHLLDNYNKMTNINQIQETFDLCHKHKFKTLAHFILGLPGETEKTVMETIELAKKIKCDYVSFNIVTPTHGTALREECLKNKWIKEDDGELDSSEGFPTIEIPGISKDRLWELRNYAIRSFYLRPSYILRKLFGVKTAHELISLFREGTSMIFSMLRGK